MGNKTSAWHRAKPNGDAMLQPACVPTVPHTGLAPERGHPYWLREDLSNNIPAANSTPPPGLGNCKLMEIGLI